MADDTKFTLLLNAKVNVEELGKGINSFTKGLNKIIVAFRKLGKETPASIAKLKKEIEGISAFSRVSAGRDAIRISGLPKGEISEGRIKTLTGAKFATTFPSAEATTQKQIKNTEKLMQLESQRVIVIQQIKNLTKAEHISKGKIINVLKEQGVTEKKLVNLTLAQSKELKNQLTVYAKSKNVRKAAETERINAIKQQAKIAKSALNEQARLETGLVATQEKRKNVVQATNLILEREPILKKQVSGILAKMGVQHKNIDRLTTKQQESLKKQLQILSAQRQAREKQVGQLRSIGYAMERIGGQLKQIGIMGLAALGGLIKESVKFNLEILKMSKGLDVPLRDLGKLAFIADATGVPLELLTKGVGNYYQALLTAGQGTSFVAKRVQEALDSVGISSLKLGQDTGMSTINMLQDMRQVFQELEYPQDKMYLGQKLFGQVFESFIPILYMSNEQWAKMGATFERIFPDFEKNAEKMEKKIYDINAIFAIWRMTMRSLGSQLLESALPMLEDLNTQIKNLIKWFSELTPETKNLVSKLILLGPPIAIILGYIIQMNAGLLITVAALHKLGGVVVGTIGIYGALALAVGWLVYEIHQLVNYEDEAIKAFNKTTDAAKEQKSEFNTLIDAYKELSDNVNRTEEEENKLLKVISDLQTKFPDFAKGIDLQKTSLSALADEAERYRKELDTIIKIKGFEGWLESAYKTQAKLMRQQKEAQDAFNAAQVALVTGVMAGTPLREQAFFAAKKSLDDLTVSLAENTQNIKDIYNEVLGLTALLPVEDIAKKAEEISKTLLDFQDKINKILAKGIITDKTVSEYENQIQRLAKSTQSITATVKAELERHESEQNWIDYGNKFFDSILPEAEAKEKLKIVRNTFQSIEKELDKLGKEKLKKHLTLFIDVGAFEEAEKTLRGIIKMSAKETKDSLDKRYNFLDEEFLVKEPALYKKYLSLRREEEAVALEIEQKDLESGLQKIADARLKIRLAGLKKEAKLLADTGNLEGAYRKELEIINASTQAQIDAINLVSDLNEEAREEKIEGIKDVDKTLKKSAELKYTQNLWKEKKLIHQEELRSLQRLVKYKLVTNKEELAAYKLIYAVREKEIEEIKLKGEVSATVAKEMEADLRKFGEQVDDMAREVALKSPFEQAFVEIKNWLDKIHAAFSAQFIDSIKNFWSDFINAPQEAMANFGNFMKDIPKMIGQMIFQVITASKKFKEAKEILSSAVSAGDWEKVAEVTRGLERETGFAARVAQLRGKKPELLEQEFIGRIEAIPGISSGEISKAKKNFREQMKEYVKQYREAEKQLDKDIRKRLGISLTEYERTNITKDIPDEKPLFDMNEYFGRLKKLLQEVFGKQSEGVMNVGGKTIAFPMDAFFNKLAGSFEFAFGGWKDALPKLLDRPNQVDIDQQFNFNGITDTNAMIALIKEKIATMSMIEEFRRSQ